MSLRQHRQEAACSAGMPGRGEIVTILSGKGGVGKTNLALNLAIRLARQRIRTVLVDADFGPPSTDILLQPSAHFWRSQRLPREQSPELALLEGPDGLRVLPGLAAFAAGNNSGDCAASYGVRIVERLRACSELVLVDCAAGAEAPTIALGLAADRVLLITTPEPTALTEAYAALKALRNRGYVGRTSLVVNMAGSRQEAEQASRRLMRAAEAFLGLSIEDIGHVPYDRHVSAAVRARVPVIERFPQCAASGSLDQITFNRAQNLHSHQATERTNKQPIETKTAAAGRI